MKKLGYVLLATLFLNGIVNETIFARESEKKSKSKIIKLFNPDYALEMHNLPGGLTNTDGIVSIVKVNPDNENHQHGFKFYMASC